MGRVRSFHCDNVRILKQITDNDGYKIVNLNKNGVEKTYKVHRLVAHTFIPNHENLPQVNHKDEDKSNNCVDNLEWCNGKYNCNYGTRTERQKVKTSKPILQYTKNGNLIGEFPSIHEASRHTNIFLTNISACCNCERRSAGGYKWKFK